MVQSNRAQRTLLIYMHRWKPPRVRCRRLRVYSTDPKRAPRDLGTTNRQDSTDAPAMVASSISRIKKINFFGPQEVYHRSLWTISELNDTQTAACRIWFRTLVCLLALAHAKTSKTQTIPFIATDGTLILLQCFTRTEEQFCGVLRPRRYGTRLQSIRKATLSS